jgi:putative endonuclease
LVFVEVKTRWNERFGLPQAAVTPKKQQQISAVAAHYLQANQLFDQPCRFVDVVAIRLNWQNRLIDLQHIENAFLYAAAAES